MFKIESYVTPILLSYVDKYVKDFKPADAQVSLWGGGVALHNLVLKADVLQQEVALPFTLVSGRIHELLIQVPWTKIMSEPIIVTIDTIECVLSLNPPVASEDSPPSPSPSNRKSTVMEAPPGYMQALVRRIVSNISLRVHHLIVKYVQDDIVMSLNVKHLAVDSAGANWEPTFADIEQSQPLIRRLVRLDDLTLCLDKSDGDGKIRFFQEPLLYRCQLDLRVLTRLISANTRRATSLDVQLRSGKLAWSVTNEQLALLLRLIKERPVAAMPPPMPKQNVTTAPLHAPSANAAEPVRSESWSEWAWSWLPTWVDREHGTEEAPPPATPLPVTFVAFFDDVSLMFKVMESETHVRRRSRDVLELCATHAALKSSICSPTMSRVRFGAREVTVRSQGKCVCGFVDYLTSNLKPTLYLQKATKSDSAQEWTWPEEVLSDKVEEAKEAVDEPPVAPPGPLSSVQPAVSQGSEVSQEGDAAQMTAERTSEASIIQLPDIPDRDEVDELWTKMEPLVYIQYIHERSPPVAASNPYDNPPSNFEYSDWVEECSMSIVVAPVNVRMCMGLIHRVAALHHIYKEHALHVPDPPRRVLTVEENESLSENLPQISIKLEVRDMRVHLIPWDHSTSERPSLPTLVMLVELPYTKAVIMAPMYPHRVCSAASQMPTDTGSLWQGARRHLTLIASAVQVHLANYEGNEIRPCGRADIRLVTHQLLHKEFFAKRQSVELSYNLKITDMNVCGSAARLQAAYELPMTLVKQEASYVLKHTTLPNDAVHDENAVAIDINLEEFSMRGYITNNIKTHVISLHSAKITALQESRDGEQSQAWLLSAPDVPTSTPYLRLAFQWCNEAMDDSLDYCGVWTEPLAISIDPLLISYLGYKPLLKSEGSVVTLKSNTSSSQQVLRRRITPPSSSGRGGSRGSGAELVHVRSRSHGSSSEPSDKKGPKIPPKTQPPQQQEFWLSSDEISKLHNRLRNMLVNVELGLALVYVTMSTASAVNCATLRDAMERHANDEHRVLVFCLGRLSMQSSSITRRLWLDIQHDGPTFLKEKKKEESFPWKIRLADVSCYTLEARSFTQTQTTYKSTLKTSEAATVRTVLDLVTTTITVSVVTKTMKFMAISKDPSKKPSGVLSAEEKKTRFFRGGLDFKPTSLREFIRGPSNRMRTERKQKSDTLNEPPLLESTRRTPEQVILKEGPLISLGINLHADTPPIILRLEQDQVKVVAAAVHCLTHILTVLQRPPVTAPPSISTSAAAKSGNMRSTSELEEIHSASEDTSDNPVELVAIFDRMAQYQRPLKTFFWFQWVVSRVTLVVASETVKLALDIDDVIGTVDFQAEYNQLKLKLASASIKHYERSESDDWSAGVMGGRVLEAREPVDAKEDGHFLTVTVTQAQVSHLPPVWKEDLNAKLHDRNMGTEYMWEVYATLAPLESIIQPKIIDNVMSLVRAMSPRAFCPLKEEIDERAFEVQWPLCYLNAGGLRVLITGGDPEKQANVDDTIIITVGKIHVNPQPDNPICRRPVNAVCSDTGWLHNGGFDGRQYEIIFKTVSVQSSKFKDIALSEATGAEKKGAASDNPALKWSQKNEGPEMVAILHTIELSWVYAPALYVSGLLTYGSAFELNLLSDCKLELSVDQLVLFKQLIAEFSTAACDTSSEEFDISGFVCPYATFFKPVAEMTPSEESIIVTATPGSDTNQQNSLLNLASQVRPLEPIRTMSDSGVETFTNSTKTRLSDDVTMKKSASVVFADIEDASQFMELFITMGVIEISLYVTDGVDVVDTVVATKSKFRGKREKNKGESESLTSVVTGRSLTYTERGTKAAHNILDTVRVLKRTSQLLHVTLYQPNVYYWKRKTQKTLQLFLFNARVAVIMQNKDGQSREALLDTAKGSTDPVTGIPPALATFKLVLPSSSTNSASALTNGRGVMSLDIERPVQIYVSTEKLHRLRHIHRLLYRNLGHPAAVFTKPTSSTPFLYNMKNKLISEGMECITIQTSQVSVCGQEGVVGWDSSSLEICTSARPEGITARGLITALLVSAGAPTDWRNVVLQPLMLGLELEAFWEAWRRAEFGPSAREPTIQISVELDDVTVELCPDHLASLNRLQAAYQDLLKERTLPKQKASEPTISAESTKERPQNRDSLPSLKFTERQSTHKISETDDTDHFYKDDLRSGAFKILSGGQLPMAYQVMLSGNAVSWRYPHPRAITRIVAFPLPGQDKEIECVLELYSSVLQRWEPHTYFKLPVGEPREMQLFVPPPDTVFAIMWRFRACSEHEQPPPPYEFNMHKFNPSYEPLVHDEHRDAPTGPSPSGVTAEQLSGVLRVDSYFAPRLLPRTNAVVRFANLYLHVHNSLPVLSSYTTFLAEGYYVSKPMMRTHRVLTVCARNTAAHALLGSNAGTLVVADTILSCDLLDCATGTLEVIIEEFRLQSGLSVRDSLLTSRTRLVTSGIHMAMQVLRLKTLQALANDWTTAYSKHFSGSPTTVDEIVEEAEMTNKSKHEVMNMTTEALEGRVSLWIHNSCSCAMRVGQDETDEATPLAPGARLAYRWRNPTAPKKLRFAFAGPAASWQWSSSLRFVAGTSRLKIESPDTENSKQFFIGSYINVKVEESQAIKCMHLSGRLVLANMLRNTLLYKVRSHDLDSPQWYTVNSGEMPAEAISRSVVCGAECDMVLKIKFKSQNTCWSGDIPLKECPKENVPWLVKVPTSTDNQFVSVWCRVVRGRVDGRILAAIWPLYVLHSHLPLDTEVLIETENLSSNEDLKNPRTPVRSTTQTTPGRGASTHLQAPGTTSARHSLSFHYKDADCVVTREAVPMHYGVTDTSVFDKRSPILNIDDVIKDIKKWLERTSYESDTKWPYSVVYKHFDGVWKPASLQPRCDVTVRYQAVRAGGGCSLEVLLCPMVLLCNASRVSLTLRSYDAAPLCKLQAGTAISPPTAIIQKPFFISVEIGRETFVSSQLQVSTEDPGRYGTPPPGQVAIDHPTNFAILCNQKVALLTLYYEIKENIHVLGVSSSYELINRLNTDVLISAIALPNDAPDQRTTLRPQAFKTIPPTKEGSSARGVTLHRFWLRQRWRGGDPAELRNYVCISLPESTVQLHDAVPIRLGQPPLRRAVSLINSEAVSIPVVVTQIKHDSRWLVVLAPDPCPQFLVQNHTSLMLTIAQPKHCPDEPSSSRTEAVTECSGVKWWCKVAPNTAVHYSTPAYSARYPPEALPPQSMASPILTVSKGKEEAEMEWCAPVVAADGEQLLQYSGGLTIKLRVHTHPHSTLLELQHVDHNDISASDIRRRLMGAFDTNESTLREKAPASLERADANTGLLDESVFHLLAPTQDLSTTTRKLSTDTNKTKVSYVADSSETTMVKSAVSAPYLSQAYFPGIEDDSDFEALGESWTDTERFRCVIAGMGLELAASSDVMPLLELHLDRTTVLVQTDKKKIVTTLSIMDAQIDNVQYETGQYDFAVVASTRATALQPDQWPPLWNMFALTDTFATRSRTATLMLKLTHDKWELVNNKYKELTEVEIRVGTLALYIEDAYVKALADMSRLLLPAAGAQDYGLSEERTMQQPLRLRLLHVHPLDLTLTLHTAVRMYIALDQSPLRLSAFKLHDMMTSAERLTHALTVHYLSAAILGAGWVVGGLELLGAPGALAARVGGATGGVRGVASAAAAALLRSLSAWAGSLARNLDLLAGDEEHARRAAAARRRPPPSFVAGLMAGITNFAINILGAVGGLAHHPLVGVAVGETESGAAGLRRGLLGALTKPLSATADLVAYAGSGLLRQTGWDPVPEPRHSWSAMEARKVAGWQRDCVRWLFRLCELTPLTGFEVLVDNAPLQILLTHKFLVVAEHDTERIVEMIDYRFCTLEPCQGQIIVLAVTQKRQSKAPESKIDLDDDENRVNAAAMARVARYTGAEGGPAEESRVMCLLPPPGRSYALYAALAAALHHNTDTHFSLL